MNVESKVMTEQLANEISRSLFPGGRPLLLAEGKSYGTRRSFSDEKQILMNTLSSLVGSLKGNLDQKLIKDSIAAYDDLKDEFKDALFGILKSYQDEEIDAATFTKLMRSEIQQAWASAYEAGVGASGNPFGVYDQDRVWLKGAEKEEFGYLKGFAQDMEDDAGVMDYEDRLQMYVDTLDGVYNHGKVEASPAEVEIYWELDPSANNCSDCIERADPDNNPYTKDTLPGTPGDGSCLCKSNCRCSLRIVQTGETPGAQAGISGIATQRAPRIPSGKRLPTYQEYEKISSLQAEIDRINGMIDATSDKKAKADLIDDYRDLVHQRVAAMGSDIYYVPKSNYFQGSENPFLRESLEENFKQTLPHGCRSPSDKEKEKLDGMINEINDLRKRITSVTNGNRKDLIAQRFRLNEEVIGFMERHNIHYLPREYLPSTSPDPRKVLAEQLAHGITTNLFGAHK